MADVPSSVFGPPRPPGPPGGRSGDRAPYGGDGPRLDPPRTGDIVHPVSDFQLSQGIRLLGPLERGGQGQVFRCRLVCNPDRGDLAIKLTGTPLSGETVARLNTLRDTNSFTVRHPNVVRLLTGGETRDHGPYFLSELARGVSLADWLRASGRLEPRQAAAIAAVAADALAAVHADGLVHCDVKPGNLFGCDANAAPVPTDIQLGDFGLSQRACPPDGRCAPGTVPYLPPERLVGGTDPRSDVFALGMTLVALVAGELPVPADHVESVRAALSSHLYRPMPAADITAYAALLDAVRAAVAGRAGGPPVIADPVLRAVVLKCLADSPDKRYASAALLRDDLHRWLEDRTTEGSGYPYTRREEAELFFRRCRRSEPVFRADQARLWGWCALALIGPTLLFAWGGSVAVALGTDPNLTPLLTGLAWTVFCIAPATVYAGVMTRWRGVVSHMGWFMGGYVFTVLPVQILVLNNDVIAFTQVVWAYAGLITLLLGLSDPVWSWAKWLGVGCIALTVPVCLLLQRFPDDLRPWTAGLVSLMYTVFFVLIALRHLGMARQAEKATASLAS